MVKTVPEIIVEPFGVEADHPRNSNLILQCIPGASLRSAISGTKGFIDTNGNHKLPIDQAMHLASFPATPGQQIHVNPTKLTYRIIDPLGEDKALLERILQFLKQNQGLGWKDIKAVPTQSGTLDIHRMKTLCRELYNIVKSKEAKITMGSLPTLEDIDNLPGYYLLDPGSRIPSTRPVYEKDLPAFQDRLAYGGG